MDKRYLIFIFIVFLFSVGFISAHENDTVADDGTLSLSDDEALQKTYYYDADTGDEVPDDSVVTHNVVKYYGDTDTKFRVKVYDNDYSPEKGVGVSFGKDWDSLKEKTTNSKGIVNFPVNYKVGKHSVITYVECEDGLSFFWAKNKVTIKSTIKPKVMTKHINEKSKSLKILFLNSKGKKLTKSKVTLKVSGKTYAAKTNSKGIAKFKVNGLKIGKHAAVAVNIKTGERKKLSVKILEKRKVRSVTVKVHDLKKTDYFRDKATPLEKGDAVICFNEYSSHAQYLKGVNIDHWYIGPKGEDIDAHHTKIVKAKIYFKNSKGNTITKTKKPDKYGGYHFDFIKGYTAYRVKIWYVNHK